ncbi:MAG: restriction endonuclease, partial [Dehalococcoidia bacterium]|nr:restriction endonuclease [Dehalococcoidia bacterium]
MASPVASQIKLYKEAQAAYINTKWETARAQREAARARREAERAKREAESARRRKFQEHWMSPSGAAFERELATLYRRLGYRVESTPSSGDQGVDLVLRKDGKTTVVQCKGHQDPVGPAIARELLGSIVHFAADYDDAYLERQIRDLIEDHQLESMNRA